MPHRLPRPWSRREFVSRMPVLLAGLGAATRIRCGGDDGGGSNAFPDSTDEEALAVFPQGIASGDPRPDGVLLWARVPSGDGRPVEVAYQVGADEAFSEIIASGAVTATEDTDHTVRLRLEGLEPARRYWYRFRANDTSSPVGRTRTAPLPDADVPVTLAFTSCQDYVGRWYHAWRALAERAEEIDFVLFLGDYIYEYERFPDLQIPKPGREQVLPDGLVVDEANGVVAALTLEDFRYLYKLIRSDADLRRIHQLCPFVIIWDDHEHGNDCWQDHTADFNDLNGDEKDTARREAATRAWYEHLPVDVPFTPERGYPDDIVTYRSLRWGKHMEMWLTDQRYYRDDHLVPEGPVDLEVGKFLANSPVGSRTFVIKTPFEAREAVAQPTMLGLPQRDWLTSGIAASQATWKVWASGLMVAQMVLDLSGFKDIPPTFQNRYFFKTDQWDGFLTERRRILEAASGVDNFVVLSGDLHGFYAANLHTDFDRADGPAGVEFTVAGISSISLYEQVDAIVKGQPLLSGTSLKDIVPLFDSNLMEASPHFLHADSKGYGAAIARFDADGLDVEFIGVTGVTQAEWNGEVGSLKFRVEAGSQEIKRVG